MVESLELNRSRGFAVWRGLETRPLFSHSLYISLLDPASFLCIMGSTMKTPNYYNVVLFDRQGYELTRAEALEGMKRAKEHAKHLLSDEYARGCENTHADMGTMKVAIFKEDDDIGANNVCEWDKEHPQHGEWLAAQDAKAARDEVIAEAQREGW